MASEHFTLSATGRLRAVQPGANSTAKGCYLGKRGLCHVDLLSPCDEQARLRTALTKSRSRKFCRLTGGPSAAQFHCSHEQFNNSRSS